MESAIFSPKKYFYKLLSNEGNEQSLKKFGFDLLIKLSTNNIDKNGDIIVNLLSSISPKEGNDRKQSSENGRNFMENYWRNQSLIAGYSIIRDLSYKMVVKRSLFFKLSISSAFEPEVWLKSNRPKGKFDICVTLSSKSGTSSVSDSRCSMIENHITNLFRMASIAVNINTVRSPDLVSLKADETSRNHYNDHCLLLPGIKLKEDKILENADTLFAREECQLIVRKLDLKYMIESNCHSKYDGAILLCSSVIDQKESIKLRMTFDEYKSLLEKELYKASVHKHGDMSSNGWKEFISNAARNCIILQFMNVAHLSPIKVALNNYSSNSRAGAFVLYNYARICMLLKNLQKMIDKNLLPPIPPTYSVDFSLLKHQEEWELCWVYISRLPELVYETLDEIINLGINVYPQSLTKFYDTKLTNDSLSNLEIQCEAKMKTKTLHFPTHKIAKFVHRLSHCWSVYYNRVHILPSVALLENEPVYHISSHLISTLWARVYLIKAVQTTFDTCFKTLDIIPPQVM